MGLLSTLFHERSAQENNDRALQFKTYELALKNAQDLMKDDTLPPEDRQKLSGVVDHSLSQMFDLAGQKKHGPALMPVFKTLLGIAAPPLGIAMAVAGRKKPDQSQPSQSGVGSTSAQSYTPPPADANFMEGGPVSDTPTTPSSTQPSPPPTSAGTPVQPSQPITGNGPAGVGTLHYPSMEDIEARKNRMAIANYGAQADAQSERERKRLELADQLATKQRAAKMEEAKKISKETGLSLPDAMAAVGLGKGQTQHKLQAVWAVLPSTTTINPDGTQSTVAGGKKQVIWNPYENTYTNLDGTPSAAPIQTGKYSELFRDELKGRLAEIVQSFKLTGASDESARQQGGQMFLREMASKMTNIEAIGALNQAMADMAGVATPTPVKIPNAKTPPAPAQATPMAGQVASAPSAGLPVPKPVPSPPAQVTYKTQPPPKGSAQFIGDRPLLAAPAEPGTPVNALDSLSKKQRQQYDYFLSNILGNPTGGGRGGAAFRLMHEKGREIFKDVTGMSEEQINAGLRLRTALGKSLGATMDRYTGFRNLEGRIAAHAELVRQAKADVDDTGSSFFNRMVQGTMRGFSDAEKLAALDTSVNELAREYAIASSNGWLSNAMVHVQSQEDAKALINSRMTRGQLEGFITQLQKEVATSKAAQNQVLGSLFNALRNPLQDLTVDGIDENTGKLKRLYSFGPVPFNRLPPTSVATLPIGKVSDQFSRNDGYVYPVMKDPTGKVMQVGPPRYPNASERKQLGIK